MKREGFTQQHELLERFQALENVRAPRIPHWQDITQYLIPYGGRYIVGNDREADRYQDIIDETGTNALEVVESGLMAYRTSPARPWFRLQTRDPQVNRYRPVRGWFSTIEEVIRWIFRKGNTNLALPHLYSETAAFGTAATIMRAHHERMLHHHILTAGEYVLGTNQWQEIDTIGRKFEMTVAQVVREFGLENCSQAVVNLYKDGSGELHAPITVYHIIEPRHDRDPEMLDSANMAWKSCYFEEGADRDQYLRIGGHQRFPGVVSRWRVTGGDVWGDGLGTKALGSIRQLQVEQMAKARAIEHQSDPVKQVPAELRDLDRDLLPGGSVPYTQTGPGGGIRNAFEVPLRIDYMVADIEDVRRRINASFHVPLFQPVTMLSDTTQRTAQEILQRREEVLTILGPVTQRMHGDIDEPLLLQAFEVAVRLPFVPPPPRELLGEEIDVEFIGPLAQALKMVDAANIERMVAHLGTIAPLNPSVVDRYDFDRDVEIYSDLTGVDPSLIIAGEKLVMLRKARAQSEAAAAQMQADALAARTAKDLASAKTNEANAYTDRLATTTGY